MREQSWFDDGERGAHRPEHAEVRRLEGRLVRRWGVLLALCSIAAAAGLTMGGPAPVGTADALGLMALTGLTLIWARTEALGALAAVGLVLSLRNTALQGPLGLSIAWLLAGLLAIGSLRRTRHLERKHRVRPTGTATAWFAACAATIAILLVVLHVPGWIGPGIALEGACWSSALAVGLGIAGGTADHPGKLVSRLAAVAGGLVLGLLALLILMAYGS